MPVPLYTPRVNNNDDSVRLSHLFVDPGTRVKQGDPIADVETDKATFTVEAEQEGYVLSFNAKKGDTIEVGSVLAWIGSSVDELAPQPAKSAPQPEHRQNAKTSLKAALLLAQYGLDASSVAANGERLSVADVERYISERGLSPARPARVRDVSEPSSLPTGKTVQLSPTERGMLRTVEWHKTEAVPAYVEISYEDSAWAAYAANFQKQNKLLMSPLLALLAWRLVQIAGRQAELNTTMTASGKYLYDHVNLGFTVQAGERLYVVVIDQAEGLGEAEFVQRLAEVQRAAMKNELRPQETSGATISFSSMARWPVSRHMPILMPYTAMMVAHTASQNGTAHLGATYDHRVLTGAAAVKALQELSHP